MAPALGQLTDNKQAKTSFMIMKHGKHHEGKAQ
jgi:hypothetical protein